MAKETKEFKTFDDFTNLYEVQKTLRFELEAVPETEIVLENRGIWYKRDKKRADEKPIVKFYMDILHREFTDEALEKIKESGVLNLSGYFKLFEELRRLQNHGANTKEEKKLKLEEIRAKKREISNELSQIRRVFSVRGFDVVDSDWKKKYTIEGKKIKNDKSKTYLILSENILNFLENRFTSKEVERLRSIDKKHVEDYGNVVNSGGENIFATFKGFFGYFDSLIKNRENFYETDGKAGRVATRSVDENLNFFAENLHIFSTDLPKALKDDLSDTQKAIFERSYYKNCLLQKDIKSYNLIIGDINKEINKHRQQRDTKIKFLNTLFKQILSIEEKEQYKHIEINNDEDLIRAIRDFISLNESKISEGTKIFNQFIQRCLQKEDLGQIYLPKDSVNTIAHRIFKPWDEIMALFDRKYFVSLEEIKDLTESSVWKERVLEESKTKSLIFKDTHIHTIISGQEIFSNFILILEKEYKNQFSGFISETRRGKAAFVGYDESLKNLRATIKWFEGKNLKLSETEKVEWIKAIKDYADAALRIFQMTKYLWLPVVGDEEDKDYLRIKAEIDQLTKDNDFYNKINAFIDGYKPEPFIYRSSFQEYLTRRPFSTDKFKINFENSRLLDGWDKDMIDDRMGILLQRDGDYFLGILNKEDRHCLDNLVDVKSEDKNSYALMQFKQLTGLYRQLPRMAFPKKKQPVLEANAEIKKIKEDFDFLQKQKKEREVNVNVVFDNKKLNLLINHYAEFLKENYKDEKCYDFSLLNKEKVYESLSDFYADVDKITYSLSFIQVSIDQLIKTGKILLFRLKNKDLLKGSLGQNKNLHTYYFHALFERENLSQGRIRLGAQAEIFFRPASIEKEKDKNRSNALKKSPKTRYVKEILKNKRYSEDKVFLHLPIQLNADAYDLPSINQNVFEFIKNRQEKVKIIGIDRGEKNLAYYSVISQNSNGKIKIEEPPRDLNLGYLEPLDELENKRQDERKAWQSISEIKSKRDGYISYAVSKIVELMLKYQAIIVLEDLSGKFKRSRMKFEKAPYQQLELALIKKLNYLVKKNSKSGKPGHYLSAYQLTEPVGSYKEMGKQTGIIFYTQAGYTSRTCPTCGWRKRVQGLYYKDRTSAQRRFDPKTGVKIFYDSVNDRFVFQYHPVYEQKELKEWDKEIYSDVTRIRWNNEEKKNNEYRKGDITLKIKRLFRDRGIDLSRNINEQLVNVGDASFWEELINLLRLITEIRNIDNENNRDFIECPHCHFQSENGFHGVAWNGDANGAYNIARKGLLITKAVCDPEKNVGDITWSDLKVDMKDWDAATDEWAKKNPEK